ncbi:MAG: DNA-binding protein WhiA [Clostridiales bacterium]|nr:DNA-binding protein WhiA [Clostridiales bacterium]
MSFSSDVKTELCQAGLDRPCCTRAEAYGVLLFCNSFSPFGIRITTQSQVFGDRLPRLFQAAFGFGFDQQPEPGESGKLTFQITDRDHIQQILDLYGYSREGLMTHHINYGVLEEHCCYVAFCRGAFLAGGSVTDPQKGYHLEIATSHLYVHREFQALMPELHLYPRETTRKANYITYFKQSEAISNLLTTIGASECAQRVRTARQQKNLVNGVNRQYNCDVANVEKSVQAAQTQIQAIHVLEARGTLEQLPDKLQETAALRCAHPELSLIQLADLCQPPVSKSCLNHRLRKLLELAER